jgi:hypothetical protein
MVANLRQIGCQLAVHSIEDLALEGISISASGIDIISQTSKSQRKPRGLTHVSSPADNHRAAQLSGLFKHWKISAPRPTFRQ